MIIDYTTTVDYVPEPTYSTDGAAGMDLRAAIKGAKTIKPGEVVKVDTGLCISIPEGYFGLLASRSGLGQAGIHLANGIGVIDSDYRGEVAVLLKNSSDEPFEITSSMRVAQLIIVPFAKAELHDMFELADTGRGVGGFGSTGLD